MTTAAPPLSRPRAETAAARATGVWKEYGSGEAQVTALRGVDIALDRGRFTAIMGPSGSGKSTLMHCLAGLDSVTRGQIHVGETQVTGLSDKGLTKLRRDKVGFIFQQFNLLPTLSAEENILLPLAIAGRKPDPAWYDTVIDTVGLRDRLKHAPASSPAASNSASPAPAPSSAAPRSSSPTNPPATSTAAPAPRSSASCAAASPSTARPSSWSPTTPTPPRTPTGSCSSPTARSCTSWPRPAPTPCWTR
ncbi:hypothetical protein Cs7R123_19310 [Catellatospora sp. TT07R-123]|nr:hypothetical protein Cs7R123_19310 [Catellatospora sp. TT07R-123]